MQRTRSIQSKSDLIKAMHFFIVVTIICLSAHCLQNVNCYSKKFDIPYITLYYGLAKFIYMFVVTVFIMLDRY